MILRDVNHNFINVSSNNTDGSPYDFVKKLFCSHREASTCTTDSLDVSVLNEKQQTLNEVHKNSSASTRKVFFLPKRTGSERKENCCKTGFSALMIAVVGFSPKAI
jgi:hypothetical protein